MLVLGKINTLKKKEKKNKELSVSIIVQKKQKKKQNCMYTYRLSCSVKLLMLCSGTL